jgi:hypothetical protein
MIIQAGDQILGLGERSIGHGRPALTVVADPQTLRRESLPVDGLARLLKPGREVVHVLDVVAHLLGRPALHGNVVQRRRSSPVVLELSSRNLAMSLLSVWRNLVATLTPGTDPTRGSRHPA